MRILSLSLKGLTVFKDTVAIDFQNLPAGLIAVVGANGAGKSTLMESAFVALFREFPSRDKFNLYRYASGKDAFVNFAFEIGGHQYESKVLINAHSEAMSAYLSCNGIPLDECRQGKLGPHTKAVERIVGTSKLLLSSVFGVQTKRGNFAEMAVSERKSLFVELLGLGQFPAYEKQSKAQGDAAELELIRLRMERDRISQSQSRMTEVSEILDAQREELIHLHTSIQERSVRIETLKKQSDMLSAQIAASEATANEQRRGIDVRRTQNHAARTDVDRKLRDRSAELLKAKVQREKDLAVLVTKMADIQKRIQNNEDLLKRSDEVRAAVQREEILKLEIAGLEQEEQSAIEAEQAVVLAKSQQRSLQSEQSRIETQIEWFEKAASELKAVPCNAEGIYSHCIKITSAVEQAKQIPGLKQSWRDTAKAIEVVTGHLGKGDAKKSAEFRAERIKVTAELEFITKVARLAPSLETTEQRIKEHRESLQEAQTRYREINPESKTPTDALYEELEKQLASLIAEGDRILEDDRVWHASHDDSKVHELGTIVAKLSVLVKDVDASKTLAGRLEGTIASLSGELERLRLTTADADGIQEQIVTVTQDLSDWNLLAKACGPNGVPALEIDAAGPGISALVNDLLASCFSTRFSVQLSTQKASTDGKKMLESFDIRVIDSERGREGTLDDLSGGEKTVVGEALALGLALYNKGSHDLRTIWRDESTGSLSVDIAPKYIAMLRRALQLGRFERVLFVTHSPECADLADARLRCADGKVSVEL